MTRHRAAVTTTFTGKTDLATKYYLFTENAGTILQHLLDGAPAFDGTQAVTYDVPGPLDHMTVSPNPGVVVAGASLQFTAQGYDVDDKLIPDLEFAWSVANGGGTINPSGLFPAGTAAGTFRRYCGRIRWQYGWPCICAGY